MNTKIFTSQALYEAAKVYVDWVPGDAYVAPHFTFINDDDDTLGEEYHLLQTGPNGKIEFIDGYKKVVTQQGQHKYEDTILCELASDEEATNPQVLLEKYGITTTVKTNSRGEKSYQYTAVVSHQNVPLHENKETGKFFYYANGEVIEVKDTDVIENTDKGPAIDVKIIAVLDFHHSMEATDGYYQGVTVDPNTGRIEQYLHTTDVWTDSKGLFCIPSEDDIRRIFLKFVEAKDRIAPYYSYVGDNNTVAILTPEEEDNLETNADGAIILFTTITHENALVKSEGTGADMIKYVEVNGNKVGVKPSDIVTYNGIEVAKVSFEVWLTYHEEVPAVKAHYEDALGNHYHPEDITVKSYTSKDEWKFILIEGVPCNNNDLEVVDEGSAE